MVQQATWHVVTLGLSAAATGGLAVHAWSRRREPGVAPFVGLMLTFTAYTLTHLGGLLTPAPAARVAWEALQWTTTMAIPVCWLAFAFEYTGHDELVTRRTLGLLSVVPAAGVVLIWTNGWHGLVYPVNDPTVVDGLSVMRQEFGPAFYLSLLYLYACILAGSLLLVRLVFLSEFLYLDQAVLLTVGVAVPVVASILVVARASPIPGLDVTPYTFTLSGLAFGHALFRYRLFDLVAATRQVGSDAAVADLEEGFVVLDDRRQVLYLNAAAAETFDREPAGVVGEPVDALVDVGDLDFDAGDALATVTLDGRTYELRSSPVTDRHDRRIGHSLVVSDVTARERRERRLRRQRDRLETLEGINAVVRDVNRALVDARTREAVLDAVCERLVDSDLYGGAWVLDDLGTPAAGGGKGDAQGSDAATTGGESSTPAGGDDRESDAVEGPPPASVREDGGAGPAVRALEAAVASAVDEGARNERATWTTVPLSHRRTVHGTLVLATGRPDAYGDRELAVLEELGELVGHALDAVETRKLLAADVVREVELAVETPDAPLCALSTAAGSPLTLRRAVPGGDGPVAYVAVAPDGVEGLVEAASDRADVAARVVARTDDPATVELSLPGESALGAVLAFGASVRSLRAADGRCGLVVHVSGDADVVALLDRLDGAVGAVELLATRERDRAAETIDALSGDVAGELTDRQREVLEAAYVAGYFDWPRESTAEDVADALDIASATLHGHLRKAQNVILSELLGETADERRRDAHDRPAGGRSTDAPPPDGRSGDGQSADGRSGDAGPDEEIPDGGTGGGG